MGMRFNESRDIQIALAILKDREKHGLRFSLHDMFYRISSMNVVTLGSNERLPSQSLAALSDAFENLSLDDQGLFEEACREIRKFLDPNDRFTADALFSAP